MRSKTEERKSVISIYYEDGRWFVNCPLIPELNISSAATLFSLLTLLRQAVGAVAENALVTAKIMREDIERRK